MIEISKHIETLLLEHDCVIVPGLGGFVTQYTPARRVEEEQLFLPPHRTVGFNSQLTLNDGLLVQSFMQVYDINYPEAIQLIDDTVTDLKKELLADGVCELNGIGTISLNLSGDYNFTPNEAGVLAPNLYGLSSFSTPMLSQPLQNREVANPTNQVLVNKEGQKKSTYTISLNRELCNYVAAAVVAILFYFSWATPVGMINNQQGNISSIFSLQSQIFPTSGKGFKNKQADTDFAKGSELPLANTSMNQTLSPENLSQQTDAANQEVNNNPADKPTTLDNGNDKKVETTRKGYSIVLLSDVPQNNARQFADKLKKDGLDNVDVYVRHKMVRVIYGQFETESEAIGALRQLRTTHSQFQEAWVINLK